MIQEVGTYIMEKNRRKNRVLGVLLAAVVVFQTMPFEGIAVSASEGIRGGLYEHHTEHTPDCGYKEAEPGTECCHEHTDDCYRTVEEEDGSITKELDCHHEHDESCGYREAAEGSPCTFVCEICRDGTDKIPEDKTDDNEINDGESENQKAEKLNAFLPLKQDFYLIFFWTILKVIRFMPLKIFAKPVALSPTMC